MHVVRIQRLQRVAFRRNNKNKATPTPRFSNFPQVSQAEMSSFTLRKPDTRARVRQKQKWASHRREHRGEHFPEGWLRGLSARQRFLVLYQLCIMFSYLDPVIYPLSRISHLDLVAATATNGRENATRESD